MSGAACQAKVKWNDVNDGILVQELWRVHFSMRYSLILMLGYVQSTGPAIGLFDYSIKILDCSVGVVDCFIRVFWSIQISILFKFTNKGDFLLPLSLSIILFASKHFNVVLKSTISYTSKQLTRVFQQILNSAEVFYFKNIRTQCEYVCCIVCAYIIKV